MQTEPFYILSSVHKIAAVVCSRFEKDKKIIKNDFKCYIKKAFRMCLVLFGLEVSQWFVVLRVVSGF